MAVGAARGEGRDHSSQGFLPGLLCPADRVRQVEGFAFQKPAGGTTMFFSPRWPVNADGHSINKPPQDCMFLSKYPHLCHLHGSVSSGRHLCLLSLTPVYCPISL